MMHQLMARLTSKVDKIFSRPIARAYHRNWYDAGNTWMRSTWMGFPIQQCPLDMQRYQELIHSVRPRAVVQTGVNQGGSLLFLAHLLDALDNPADDAIVVGVDIKLSAKAQELRHPRIHLVEGDSTAAHVVARVRELVADRSPVVVALDSDHRCDHVFAELKAFVPFIGAGGALVVEDTNLNGHPVHPNFGPGPREALERWRRQSADSFMEIGAESDPNWLSFHSWFERR